MKRTALKRQSSKQSARLRKYSIIRKEHLEAHPYCVACYDCGDIRFATEIQHARGRLGDLLFDRRYFKSMCQYHGQKCHKNVKWAQGMGYNLDRLGNLDNLIDKIKEAWTSDDN